jgi:hypothetical protein
MFLLLAAITTNTNPDLRFITPAAIAGVRWIVFLRLFAKTKTAYVGQLAAFVKMIYLNG